MVLASVQARLGKELAAGTVNRIFVLALCSAFDSRCISFVFDSYSTDVADVLMEIPAQPRWRSSGRPPVWTGPVLGSSGVGGPSAGGLQRERPGTRPPTAGAG